MIKYYNQTYDHDGGRHYVALSNCRRHLRHLIRNKSYWFHYSRPSRHSHLPDLPCFYKHVRFDFSLRTVQHQFM